MCYCSPLGSLWKLCSKSSEELHVPFIFIIITQGAFTLFLHLFVYALPIFFDLGKGNEDAIGISSNH